MAELTVRLWQQPGRARIGTAGRTRPCGVSAATGQHGGGIGNIGTDATAR
ncbi:MAG: hypothetical protein AB3X44_00725 [Leptothrix sp. (in: b-proteobacteria)]